MQTGDPVDEFDLPEPSGVPHPIIAHVARLEAMNEKSRVLLIEVAGYLTLVSKGFPVNKKEANAILEKIGDLLAAPARK